MPSTASRMMVLAIVAVSLGACAEARLAVHAAKEVMPDSRTGGSYKVGNPYQIKGVWYYPAEDWNYDETGIASWYGAEFHGKRTANGEIYDMNALTAAHRTLPMPSYVRVTNLENGRSIVLRVNDRGPFAHSRILDVSRRGAQLLGFERQGTAKVRVQILAEESRALAMRAQGRETLASGEHPGVEAAPRVTVAAETLPPPGSGQQPAPIPVSAPAPRSALSDAAEPQLENQTVQVVPVGPARMYIQAGAFQRYDNALRVSARLSVVGQSAITPVTAGGVELFRVRMGPIDSVEEADRLLELVIRSGYPDARVVVD